MSRPFRVYAVSIGSAADEQLRDRSYDHGVRGLFPFKLPERATYYVETRMSMGWASKKALRMAAADGVPLPVVKCITLVSRAEGKQP